MWRAVAESQAKLVVGARSALFLPFPDLGLIVVDEEHDPGYKQEERVTYQARDMAVLRGSLGQFPVVLSSATAWMVVATPLVCGFLNCRLDQLRLGLMILHAGLGPSQH